MVKKRGLGRGLDALLSSGLGDLSHATDSDLKQIAVDLLQRGRYQPRVDMREESLQELAESIRAQGVIQPVIVRPISGERYEIIAGERRWRAAQLAGLHDIPAVIRDVPDEAAVAMALIENIQRENLNPLEQASALKRLIDEFDMTHEQAGDAVGRSRTAVSNLLRLLDLGLSVRPYLEKGALEMGHARTLLSLTPALQIKAAETIVKKGLSVREAEALSKRLQQNKTGHAKTGKKPVNPDVERLQQSLAEKLAAPVSIQYSPSGKGTLQVRFSSLDELEGILDHIK